MQTSSVGATKAVRVLQGRNPTPTAYLIKISVLSSTKTTSSRRPFSELNEYSLPDLERRITIAVVHNELDLAAFLNELDPLLDNEEVDHNNSDDEDTMDSNELNADATVLDYLEVEQAGRERAAASGGRRW
ncbi:unnamed protein product [Caenorhabditis nigoni]